MKYCPNPACPYLLRRGEAGEYRDDAQQCSDCGSELTGEAPAVGAAPAAADPSPWSRLAVTVAAPVAVFLGGQVLLPGLSDALHAQLGQHLSWHNREKFSLIAMGITPLVSGFALVELAALVVPRWRPLRNGSADDRAKLVRASLVMALITVVLQAYGIAVWLEGISAWPMDLQPRNPPVFMRLLVVLGLATGTSAVAGLAWLVHRKGLGNGISVLLLCGSLFPALRWIAGLPSNLAAVGTLSVAMVAAAGGAIAGATWYVLSFTSRRKREENFELVRHPAGGIVPIEFALSLISLAAAAGFSAVYGTLHLALLLALTAVLCVVLSLLFNRPDYMAETLERLGGASNEEAIVARIERELKLGVALGASYVLGLVLIDWNLPRWTAGLTVSPIAIAVATAVVMDLAAEWHMRRDHPELEAVWPLHRVWTVDLARRILAQEDIPVLARGLHHRSLLHFFGPHIPIELMVPPKNASRAREVLARALLPKPVASEPA